MGSFADTTSQIQARFERDLEENGRQNLEKTVGLQKRIFQPGIARQCLSTMDHAIREAQEDYLGRVARHESVCLSSEQETALHLDYEKDLDRRLVNQEVALDHDIEASELFVKDDGVAVDIRFPDGPNKGKKNPDFQQAVQSYRSKIQAELIWVLCGAKQFVLRGQEEALAIKSAVLAEATRAEQIITAVLDARNKAGNKVLIEQQQELAKIERQRGDSLELYELHLACEAGNLEQVKKCLKRGVAKDLLQEGRLPLHVAVESEHWDVVRYLLIAGADPEQREPDTIDSVSRGKDAFEYHGDFKEKFTDWVASQYGFHQACREGDLELVNELAEAIKTYQDRDVINEYCEGELPLYLALNGLQFSAASDGRKRYRAVVESLLIKGAKLDLLDRDEKTGKGYDQKSFARQVLANQFGFYEACEQGDEARAQYVAQELKFWQEREIEKEPHQGLTALQYAVRGGQKSMVKILLALNVDPNPEKDKRPAYVMRADPDQGERGKPLHDALRAECRGMTDALLEAGADPYLTNDVSETPLEVNAALLVDIVQGPIRGAIRTGTPGLVREPLMKKAFTAVCEGQPKIVDQPGGSGALLLHLACKNSLPEVAKKLMAVGANSMLLDADGEKAINYIDTEAQDDFIQPLHLAVRANRSHEVDRLLAGGENPSEKDIFGRTAFDYERGEAVGKIQTSLDNTFNFHQACIEGNVAKVHEILAVAKRGELLNDKLDGEYPLNLALKHGQEAVAQELMSYVDIRTDLADGHGKTARDYAVEAGMFSVMRRYVEGSRVQYAADSVCSFFNYAGRNLQSAGRDFVAVAEEAFSTEVTPFAHR